MLELYNHPLFYGIDNQDLKPYLDQCYAKEFSKGKFIYYEGDECQDLIFLIEGQVDIQGLDPSGRIRTVNHFEEGDFLAGNILFSSSPYFLMTAVASTNVTIITVPKDVFFDIMSKYPDILRTFLEYISDNSLRLGEKIKSDIKMPLRQKIMNYINKEIKSQDTHKINLDVSKTELATIFGVERTSLSRELQKMKKDGLIDYDRYTITKKRDF
jgi:CRP-like cAMP-binding protein